MSSPRLQNGPKIANGPAWQKDQSELTLVRSPSREKNEAIVINVEVAGPHRKKKQA